MKKFNDMEEKAPITKEEGLYPWISAQNKTCSSFYFIEPIL